MGWRSRSVRIACATALGLVVALVAASASASATSITMRLDAQPDSDTQFIFRLTGPTTYWGTVLQDNGTAADGINNYYTRTVTPGAGYKLFNVQTPAGWAQQSASCDDGSPLTNIDVAPGEDVTCSFVFNQPTSGINVVLDAQPDADQYFQFTTGGGLSPSTFSLRDYGGNPGNSRLFAVQPGSGYSLAETVPAGWDLTTATCSDGSPFSNIDVSADEQVTCTFTNRKRGQIVVREDSVPDDPQQFSYTAGGGLSPSSFTLSDNQSRLFANVAPGSGYSFSQAAQPGWDPTSATCTDGSPVSNVDIGPGETVTCTFTNQHQNAGTITLRLDTQPDDNAQFLFRVQAPGFNRGIVLQDNGTAADGINNYYPVLVNPGSGYSVRMAQYTSGTWSQKSATCDDGSPITSIDVSPGENVTCSFVFDQPASSITVVEDSVPNDPQDFAFTAGGGLFPSSFSLDDDGDSSLSNSRTYLVQPGSGYSVSQSGVSGWDPTSATCSDGSPISNIDVSTGEQVTCTFVNQRRGKIIVQVDTEPDDNQQSFSFAAGGGLSPSSFTIVGSDIRYFDNVVPGSGYSISQDPASGWDLTGTTCSDGSPVSNINVAPGETVTCTFTNRFQLTGTITLVLDAQPDDSRTFLFRVIGNGQNRGIVLQDNGTAADGINYYYPVLVKAGSGYTVRAPMPAGWTQQSASCSDGSPLTNVDVSANENVTCSFVYVKQP